MKKSQSGFTLIELVVVIVLLGILGVTALGKFQDLSTEASLAAVEGVAAEISASSSINYAKSLLGGTPELGIGVGATGGTNNLDTTAAADACLDTGLANLLTTGLPTGYTVTDDLTGYCAGNAGDTYSCTVVGENAQTAIATIVCTE